LADPTVRHLEKFPLATATEGKVWKKSIHVLMDNDLVRRLWHVKGDTGSSPSETVNEAVRRYFAQQDRRKDRESA
jgi:metal-responsive CopG/Arc/MetJ family transcriptional regulator